MSGTLMQALEVGLAAEMSKTYDEWDIDTFAALTGDLNPAHVDEAFAVEELKALWKRSATSLIHGPLTALCLTPSHKRAER
jgi:3-hydroxybutyryl-CoA dehydratase